MPPKTTASPATASTAPTSSTLAAAQVAAAQQQKAFSAGIAEYELPKTNLTKLAKGSIPDNVKMQQDVVLALLRSSTLFINYLSAAAQDQAFARSGKTITASDVIKAITELDFGPADAIVPLLEQELSAAAKAKKQPAAGRGKPRKSGATAQGDDVDVEMDEGEGEEDDQEQEQGQEEDDAAAGNESELIEQGDDDEA